MVYASIKRSLICGSAVVVVLFLTQNVQAISLSQMLNDVYDTNPELLAEEEAVIRARSGIDKARADFLPTISTSASGSHRTKRRLTSRRAVGTTQQYSVSLSQRLFNGFQSVNKYRGAKQEALKGQYTRRNAERRVLMDAVQAYMNVFSFREILKLRKSYVYILRSQLTATKARIKAGELTKTDLSQTEARLSRALALRVSSEADLGAALGEYARLTGYQADNLHYPVLPKRFLPQSVGAALNKAIELHPDLKAAKAEVLASGFALRGAQGAFLPTIEITASYTRNTGAGSFITNRDETTVMVRVNFDLYQGGARFADLKSAKSRSKEAQYRRRAVEDQIKADARAIYLQNTASKALVKQTRSEVHAAGEALRGIRIEEKAGLRSFVDVLDSQAFLLDAQVASVEARSVLVTSAYRVLSSTGQLSVSGTRIRNDHVAEYQVASTSRQISMAPLASKKKAGDPWSGFR